MFVAANTVSGTDPRGVLGTIASSPLPNLGRLCLTFFDHLLYQLVLMLVAISLALGIAYAKFIFLPPLKVQDPPLSSVIKLISIILAPKLTFYEVTIWSLGPGIQPCQNFVNFCAIYIAFIKFCVKIIYL